MAPAGAATLSSASRSAAGTVIGPATWMSRPSCAGSARSGVTSRTRPEPSVRERAVVTARPSFQNSSTLPPGTSSRPITRPIRAPPRRENHDWLLVSVKLSAALSVAGSL